MLICFNFVLLASSTAAGRYASFCYWFYLAYCSGLLKIHQNIDLLEDEPTRLLEAEQQKYLEEHPNGTLTVHDSSKSSPANQVAAAHGDTAVVPASSPNGKKNKHKKNKPSYAEVAANKASAKGTSPPFHATRTPNTVHLAKDLGIPSRPNPLHLLFGLPSNSRKFNYVSWLINTLLILLCLDFQFTPKLFMDVKDTTFVRVGAVSENQVKLVARVPPSLFPAQALTSPVVDSASSLSAEEEEAERLEDQEVASTLTGSVLDSIISANKADFTTTTTTTTPANEENSAKLVYRASKPAGAWHYGGSILPSPSTDYVSSITLDGLLPSTEYEYALILPDEHKNKFVTPNVEHPHHFKTFPDNKLATHQTHFTFAASSCIKQNFPYVPGQDHLSIKGAAELADRVGPDHIEFLVRSHSSCINFRWKKLTLIRPFPFIALDVHG